MNAERRRLRWRCRRGMRELDELLNRFLEHHYDHLSEPEKHTFGTLLELPDPELHGYLLGREQPTDRDQCRLLERLRGT